MRLPFRHRLFRQENAVVKPAWGTKRMCQSCGAHFYDLQRIRSSARNAPPSMIPTRYRARAAAAPAPAPKPAPRVPVPEIAEAPGEPVAPELEEAGGDRRSRRARPRTRKSPRGRRGPRRGRGRRHRGDRERRRGGALRPRSSGLLEPGGGIFRDGIFRLNRRGEVPRFQAGIAPVPPAGRGAHVSGP